MILSWRKVRTLLAVSYAEMMQYRAELYLWAISGIMPFVLMGLWMEASAETPMAITPVDFARYFLAVFIVRQATMVWVVWEFEDDVVHGRLSFLLLHPLDPAWRFFLSHVAERFARVPFLIALTGLFFLLYPKAFWIPSAADLALATAAITVAFLLRFLMQYAFAMIAFWSERANAIEDLWFMLYLFLSGFIAPLDLFPPAVRHAAEWTPFPYMIYLPARLLTGQGSDGIGRGLIVITIWSIVFYIVYRILWYRGLRHYSAMGA